MRYKKTGLFTVILIGAGLIGLECKSHHPEKSIKDMDGNVYQIITIGTQTWLEGNLKTTNYNDGTPIPLVTDDKSWQALTTSGYCWYNNDKVNKSSYGAIYNWYAISSDKVCPSGWHIPTLAEWHTLTAYLGVTPLIADSMAVWKLQEPVTTGWLLADGSKNKGGFISPLGGYRNDDGSFSKAGGFCRWWMSPEWNISSVLGHNVTYGYSGGIESYVGIRQGFSVRCIRNSPTP